jgi:hypothetical protein
MNAERRQSPRVRVYHPVRVHRLVPTQLIETLTKDLSLGGLRCMSMLPLPIASELQLEVVLFAGEEPFTVSGHTVWFQFVPSGEQYEIGIAFDALSPQDKRRLSVYFDNLSRQLSPSSA